MGNSQQGCQHSTIFGLWTEDFILHNFHISTFFCIQEYLNNIFEINKKIHFQRRKCSSHCHNKMFLIFIKSGVNESYQLTFISSAFMRERCCILELVKSTKHTALKIKAFWDKEQILEALASS